MTPGPNDPRWCLRCQAAHDPGRHGQLVEIELRGGPADGMQLAVADPPPPSLRLYAGPPAPAEWIRNADGWTNPAPVRTVDYRRLELWNPRTRRRQYGIG